MALGVTGGGCHTNSAMRDFDIDICFCPFLDVGEFLPDHVAVEAGWVKTHPTLKYRFRLGSYFYRLSGW